MAVNLQARRPWHAVPRADEGHTSYRAPPEYPQVKLRARRSFGEKKNEQSPGDRQ